MQHAQRQPLIVLGLLLCLAAFLRLYHIDSTTRFIWDEGRDMLAIRNIIVNQDLTFFGPFNEIDSRKDFFGVFHYYLMLPALWLADFNPVGPNVFTALLGVAAVALTYAWARNWLDNKSALAMTALMAVSPLVVHYSRWALNPNTIGFFGILYLLVLQTWQKKPTFWKSGIAGLLLGLLFQLHYFTVAMGVAAVFVIGWQSKLKLQQKLTHLLLLGAAFCLPNLTFVIFDLTHAGFYRNILLDSFVNSDSQQKLFSIDPVGMIVSPFSYIWEVVSGFVGNKWLGLGVGLGFVGWLWHTLKQGWQAKVASEAFQLAVAWLTFLAIVSIFPSLKDDYHSGALWLAIAASIVTLTARWWKTWPITWQGAALAVVTVFLMFQNQFWRAPSWQENIPRLSEVGTVIATDAHGKSAVNVASFVDPDTRGTRFRYFVVKEGAQLLGVTEYPLAETLYIVTPHSWEETKLNPAWELDAFREAQAERIWSDGEWNVYRLKKMVD